MTMKEITSQVAFKLGLPANKNVENLQIETAVNISFQELKRYMKTPTDKTVPFATRIDLLSVGIDTLNVLYVQEASPKVGLTLGNIESGNVFQVAAAVGTYSAYASGGLTNIDPIMTQLAYSQLHNTLTTDLQWKYDNLNQCIYCTHQSPVPAFVTIRYVPNFHDVSEIVSPTWINYLIRMTEANMKIALGRTRSKYRIEGSNVSLDGDTLLEEGNSELATIREELGVKGSKLMVLR